MMRLPGSLAVQPDGKAAIKVAKPAEVAGPNGANIWAYLLLPENLPQPTVIAAPPAIIAQQSPKHLLKPLPPSVTMIQQHAGPMARPGLHKRFVAADRNPWQNRVLVPLSLLLLTLSLWL